MGYHRHRLDASEHASLLAQSQTDPIEERPFRAGDEVVVCAADNRIFLESTWREMTCCCPCGATETLALLTVGQSRQESRFEEAVYTHRPESFSESVDLTRPGNAFPFPWKTVGLLAAFFVLLTMVGILGWKLVTLKTGPSPPVVVHNPEPEPEPKAEPEPKPKPEPESKPGPELNPKPGPEPEPKPKPEKLNHPGKPRFRFRHEDRGHPMGDFGYAFQKNLRQLQLYLDFANGVDHPGGELEIRFYEPGGRPVPGKRQNAYYQRRYRPGSLAKGLRVELKRQVRFWALGTYRVEVWWHVPGSGDEPRLLGKGSFEIAW